MLGSVQFIVPLVLELESVVLEPESVVEPDVEPLLLDVDPELPLVVPLPLSLPPPIMDEQPPALASRNATMIAIPCRLLIPSPVVLQWNDSARRKFASRKRSLKQITWSAKPPVGGNEAHKLRDLRPVFYL